MANNHGSERIKSAGNGNGSKFSLAAFSVKCYNCSQVGHRANQCPNKKKGEGNGGTGKSGEGRKKFEGKCRLCSKPGHKAVDCWNDEKNSLKRPRGWKRMEKQE